MGLHHLIICTHSTGWYPATHTHPNHISHIICPAKLRSFVSSTVSQRKILVHIIIVNGIERIYLFPQRFEQTLGATPSPLDGPMFVFGGYLHQNHGFNINIYDALFNLVSNQILFPTVVTIFTKLAADPTLKMICLYQAGDQRTEILRVRNVIPIPFTYVNIFLATSITPAYFLNHMYPHMVNDNVEAQ